MRHTTINRRTFGRVAAVAIAAMPLAAPAIASAQGATPAAGGATTASQPASGGLAAMLALAPASYPWVDDPGNLMISYADIATQLAVTGVPPVDTMDDAEGFSKWMAATRALTFPQNAAQYLKFWREDYGFDLLQAEQTLELSLPPFNLTLFRGRFDHDVVRATLTANGYRPVDVNGNEILTLRDDYEQDISGPFAYKLGAMNHVALLDDGTIACSAVQAALAAVFDIAAGMAPSLMEQAGVAMLAGNVPDDLVSAMIVSGTQLAGNLPAGLIDLEPGATPDFDAIATEIAETSEMPPVVMLLIGATAGGPLFSDDIETPPGVPDLHAIAVALMLEPESAEAAVPVVTERLATGSSVNTSQPYSDFFAEHDVQAVDGTPVLVVDLIPTPEVPPNILVNMLFNRDLGFLAW